MKCETDRREELLSRRLALMHALVRIIEGGNEAIVSRDLKLQQTTIRQQQELCVQWAQLEREMPRDGSTAGVSSMTSATRRAATELQQLNRLQGALVRRARRTVDIFCRVLASAEPTYARPSVRTGWAGE